QSPAGSLLCTMNALLQTVVYSNFNRVTSFPAVGRLYEAIGALPLAIEESAQNLALIYFARSLAVVMEEAVSRLGGGTEEQINQLSRVDSPLPTPVAAAADKPAQSESFYIAEVSKPAVAAALEPAAAATLYRRLPGGRRPAHQLDYSPEAVADLFQDLIAGRINMWCIADTVKRPHLIELLKPI
ncbi:hypothetical protein PENTCL1PPCAC_1098, partial [Pristionchus entomophagus]